MTKKSRLILFSFTALIFLAIAPLIVLYVQGYRFDYNKFSFIQTGSLYLKTEPKKALVFLNEKQVKGKTPVLINRLLPQKFNIKIEKDGFYSWEKKINVESGLVAEAKNIVLIPTKIESKKILSSVQKIYPSPRNNYFLTINKDQFTLTNEKMSRAIHLDSYFENPLGKEKIVNAIEKNEISWHRSEEKIIVYDQQDNYLVDFRNGTIKQFSIKKKELDNNAMDGFIAVKEIKWHPSADDVIFFIYNDKLYSYNMETKISEMIIDQAVHYNLSVNTIISYLYYIDYTGFINKYNFITKKIEQVSKAPIIYHKPSNIIISNDQKKIAVLEKNNSRLSLLNEDNIKVIDNVNFASFSEDSKKIMYGNANKVSILYLENTNEHPQKTKGTIEELANSDNSDITKAFWYEKTNQHLWILTDQLYFSELDNRQPRNIYTVLNNFLSDVFISGNKIYYMENNDFYFTDISR